MTITIVSTTAQLIAAISGAATGDLIQLAPGTYANVNIYGKSFSTTRPGGPSQVYIQSEFENNPAVLTGLKVQNSQGLAFGGLKLSTIGDAAASYGAAGTTPFEIVGSSNISMRAMTISGDPNGTLANTLSAMYVCYSSYVTITHSQFSYLHFAIDQFDNNHINITNNSFSHIYDDGVRGGGTSNINISGNSFSDFHPDPSDNDHPDLIQFWTTNTTKPASNITISNNTYTRGAGFGAVQGIFVADEVGHLPYHNLAIQNNAFTGTLWNGITFYDVNGATINNNTLASYSDYQAGIHLYGSQNLTVTNNSAGAYTYTGSTLLTLANNAVTPSIGANPGAPAPSVSLDAPDIVAADELDLGPEIGPEALALPDAGLFDAPVPEPQSWALLSMALGLIGLLLRGRRYRAKALC